jgi:hypothetical protein
VLSRQHHRIDILVGAGHLFRDAAGRWAANEDALRRQIVLDGAAAPLLERRMARYGAACSVARRRERLLLGGRRAGQDVGARPHAAADEHRLADGAKRGRQAFVAGAESSGRALAMNEKRAALSVHQMRLGTCRSATPMDPARFTRVGDTTWRIESQRVPGIIYADENLLRGMDDKVFEQAVNVTMLSGIVQAAHAMPEVHLGYGFPIGGVVAFDAEEGWCAPAAWASTSPAACAPC